MPNIVGGAQTMTSNGRFHPLLSDPLPTVPLDVGINTDKVKRRAHKMTTTTTAT